MKVCVKSQKMAEEYGSGKNEETSILISIAAKGDPSAAVKCSEDNKIKDILFLKFNDTDNPDEENGHIVDADAEKIRDFVEKYKDDESIDTIIVNCGAGQSRSAGVAAAILMYLTGSDRQIFDNPIYTPNKLCYRTVLKAFQGETDYASLFGAVE